MTTVPISLEQYYTLPPEIQYLIADNWDFEQVQAVMENSEDPNLQEYYHRRELENYWANAYPYELVREGDIDGLEWQYERGYDMFDLHGIDESENNHHSDPIKFINLVYTMYERPDIVEWYKNKNLISDDQLIDVLNFMYSYARELKFINKSTEKIVSYIYHITDMINEHNLTSAMRNFYVGLISELDSTNWEF